MIAGIVALGVATAGAPAGAALAGASTVQCVVDDPRAIELSGLVATSDGYVAIVDSQWDASRTVIVYLDRDCRVTRTQAYPTSPRDPEDLAVAPDGALWVADIGDNITSSQRRQTVALWRIPPGGGTPVIHRLTYPDGPHDAEALLIDGEGNPILITKELSSTAHLFRPTRALEPNTTAGVPMELVGQFRPASAGTDGLGRITGAMVTGAAISPDRSRVVVRTYTAAYEWDIPDGDIVAAITQRVPRYTPLGDDVQGEAISYTVDGQGFLTVDDATGPAAIRRYEPGQDPPPAPSGPATEPGQAADATATPHAATSTEPIPWYGFALVLGGTSILAGFGVWLLVQRRRS